MNKAAVLLLAVLCCHYGYGPLSFGDPVRAQWLFYIFRGIEGAVLFYLLSTLIPGPLAALACWLGIFEEASTAVCGSLSMDGYADVPVYSGLCIERFGALPYGVVAATAAVYLWRRYGK